MKLMVTRFYYSVAEIFAADQADYTSVNYAFYMKTTNKGFKEFINALDENTTGYTDSTQTLKLIQNYLWPTIYDQNIVYIDVHHENWEEPVKPEFWTAAATVRPIRKKLAGQIYSWLTETQIKYEKLISLYEAEQNNLLAEVSNTSISKYNDTPQTNTTGYDDTHTTNATKVVNSSEVSTKIARLEEVRRGWDNLYKAWADNFHKIFMLGE